MKKKQKKAVKAYIAGIAGRMGLTDWCFLLSVEEQEVHGEGLNTLAWVSTTPGRRHAVVHIGPDFADLSPETQRMTIVHELIHCHLAPMQDQVENDLEPHLGRAADQLFSDSFRRNLEFSVDAMATAWAEDLPLIDWDYQGEPELSDDQVKLMMTSPDDELRVRGLAEAERRGLIS